MFVLKEDHWSNFRWKATKTSYLAQKANLNRKSKWFQIDSSANTSKKLVSSNRKLFCIYYDYSQFVIIVHYDLWFDISSKQVSAVLIDYRAAIFEIDYQEISAQYTPQLLLFPKYNMSWWNHNSPHQQEYLSPKCLIYNFLWQLRENISQFLLFAQFLVHRHWQWHWNWHLTQIQCDK